MPSHPWAPAWEALSPVRRVALHSRVVDREPLPALAERLGRSEADTSSLVSSTVLAFRREVVLGLGTGYDEECGSLVLRLTDSAGERLGRGERRALAAHAESCPACAPAVAALLALDAGLRDGLIALLGTGSATTPAVPAPRAGGAAVPAPSRHRRRGWVLGAGLATTAVVGAFLLAGGPSDTPLDVVAAPPVAAEEPGAEADDALATTGSTGAAGGGDEQVRPGRTVRAAAAAVETFESTGETTGQTTGQAAGQQGPATPAPGAPGGGPGGQPGGPGEGPGDQPGDRPDPDEDPEVPPLDVAVDEGTGSVTITVGLLGDPVVVSTPPITRSRTVNNR